MALTNRPPLPQRIRQPKKLATKLPKERSTPCHRPSGSSSAAPTQGQKTESQRTNPIQQDTVRNFTSQRPRKTRRTIRSQAEELLPPCQHLTARSKPRSPRNQPPKNRRKNQRPRPPRRSPQILKILSSKPPALPRRRMNQTSSRPKRTRSWKIPPHHSNKTKTTPRPTKARKHETKNLAMAKPALSSRLTARRHHPFKNSTPPRSKSDTTPKFSSLSQ